MSCRSDVAGQIKECLSIQEVAERYGVHVESRGRALCPFHNDSHPSGSFKNGRFHCYVCGLHLDIFDFVSLLFDIDFQQAIVRLDGDFGLGVTGEKPDKKTLDEWREKKRERDKEIAAYRDEYMVNVKLHRYIWKALQNAQKPRTWSELERICWWKSKLEYLSWWLDDHQWK